MTHKVTNSATFQEPPTLAKLQSLTKKNKKLLQSISTHLISNPDEIQSKLYEHRFLEQKYNELIGFSRQNVDKYEKSQFQIAAKDTQIAKLRKQMIDNRDSQRKRQKQVQRQYEHKLMKKEEEVVQQKEELRKMREKLASAQKQKNLLASKIKEQYEPENTSLKANIESLKNELGKNELIFTKNQNERKVQQNKIEELQDRVKELQEQLIKEREQKISISKNILKKDKVEGLQEIMKKIRDVKTNIH